MPHYSVAFVKECTQAFKSDPLAVTLWLITGYSWNRSLDNIQWIFLDIPLRHPAVNVATRRTRSA